ncbi:pyroglutamyl-peptidase I family protein [Flavobacterium sp. 3-218]
MSTNYNFTYTLTSEASQNEVLNNIAAGNAKKEYSPASYFFVDESKLTAPITTNYATDAFGPVSTRLATDYRTTSKVRATATDPVKVFAICKGQVLIQPQTEDSTKVNLILKPEDSYAPLKIKYFIYRGINKADLIGNNTLKSVADDANQPIFLKRLWKQYIAFNTSLKDPSTGENFPAPTEFPSVLIGYDENQPDTTLIENYFTKKEINISYQIPSCEAGEHLGNFTGEIGLDIVLDHGDYQLQNQEELFKFDLKFARAKEHVFDTGNIPSVTDTKRKRYREYIHQFMDAAAFWGSHIQCGSIKTINSETPLKSNNDIFTKIINKYQTKNKIYIYIQGENNRSYNYYDTTRKVYGFSTEGELHNTSGWPIIIKELTVTDTVPSTELISFKLDYNIDVRIPKTERHVALDVISPNKNTSKYPSLDRPIQPETIPGFIVGKTAPISVIFQVNETKSCANFLIIYGNLKQEFPLKKYYNDLFPVNFSTNFSLPIAETENLSSWATYDKNRMVNLDYVINAGASIQNKLVFDNGKGPVILGISSRKARRLYMAIIKRNSEHNDRLKIKYDPLNINTVTSGIYKYVPKPKPEPEFGSEPEQYVQNIYNNIDFLVSKRKFATGNDINSLSLSNKSIFSKKYSYFHLGITEEEYNKLVYGQNNIPTEITATAMPQFLPNDADNVFFHLKEDLTFDNSNAKKFKVGLRFENNEGNISTLFPETANEVFVYTVDNFYFFSKEYSDYQEYSTTDYVRNNEEQIGLTIKSEGKTYEDWFIEKDSGMKNKVDAFINAFNKIKKTSNFYNSAKTLVESSALAIWNQAVTTLQTNTNTTPDDRPLYWARIKMQVALKSHPYFNGGNNADELENLILLFEERSRNYNGINFPNDKTKILITGFDPFQLNDNIQQWNPSGLAILSLHGKSIGNAIIQTMIFPVRYDDFDKGYVEKYIYPHISKVNMIITVSQGRRRFDIERFASKYRSKVLTDNLDVQNATHVFYLPNMNEIKKADLSDIPEFLETTLPLSQMIPGSLTNKRVVYNQRYVSDQSEQGYTPEDSGIEKLNAPSPGEIAEEGSGGTYLSNEIFFRVSVLRNHLNLNDSLKSGHLHVPVLTVNDYDSASSFISETTKILQDAILGL